MAIKMSQGLRQQQTLKMTPQLQQAIKLLTLTHLEMTTMIAQEMVENPMLEEMEDDLNKEQMEMTREEIEVKEVTAENFQGPELIEGARDNFDWENYADSFSTTSSSAPNTREAFDSEDGPSYENIITKGESLTDHLIWQLRMEDLGTDEMKLAMAIVHNLNEDGYLSCSFDEIFQDSPLERKHGLEILKLIQKFDPIGCACHSLEECLLIQARSLPERSPLVELILQKNLIDLEKRDYNKIIKELGVTKDKIKDAELIITSLNPKPGRTISAEETQYVVPDIFVSEVAGEFVVGTNDEGVPRLKISAQYRSMLKMKEESQLEAKEFVQDKLRSALWLIKSIENRQKTIYRVAVAIVRTQQEFFKKGPAYLKPMILKDIANEIGMHESTVSRVTTNKFMHTPIGTFELKYFFNSGIGGKNGGIDIAGETLKLKIKELIAREDTKRPLSDQRISELLSTRDIVVARRTVAKYRELMNIQPSSKRKSN
jgi:RNA polymerase sigma-54 factor